MTTITKIMVALAGLLHLVFFAMESIFFMHESVYSRFSIASHEHAQLVSLFAYNQGWYNLFLAFAAFTGVFLTGRLPKNVGATLSIYACLSMLSASIVLVCSASELMRAAIIQGTFPLLALVFFLKSIKNQSPLSK